MTRETKIGLLVGLAFIIVIGILLSDHLTSATEPQQAQLAQVAGNVRTGVTVPGGGGANPPITTVAPPAAPTPPQQTVPLKQELTPPKPPVEIVQIGGAQPQHDTPQPPITVVPPTSGGAEQTAGPTPPPAQPPTDGATPVPPPNGTLATVAKTMGEEIVSLDGPKLETSQPQPPTRLTVAPPTAPTRAGAKQYKAEAGDSVSKIARKLMGADTKANRDALVAANPTLQQNANMVIAGRTYIVPVGTPAAQPAAPPAPTAPIATNTPTPMPPPAPPTNTDEAPVVPVGPEHFYIVKSGDSLTKIAVEQLGSAGGVPAIMDLNKDVLKGKDVIRPNMKLRLPAKPLASAQ